MTTTPAATPSTSSQTGGDFKPIPAKRRRSRGGDTDYCPYFDEGDYKDVGGNVGGEKGGSSRIALRSSNKRAKPFLRLPKAAVYPTTTTTHVNNGGDPATEKNKEEQVANILQKLIDENKVCGYPYGCKEFLHGRNFSECQACGYGYCEEHVRSFVTKSKCYNPRSDGYICGTCKVGVGSDSSGDDVDNPTLICKVCGYYYSSERTAAYQTWCETDGLKEEDYVCGLCEEDQKEAEVK